MNKLQQREIMRKYSTKVAVNSFRGNAMLWIFLGILISVGLIFNDVSLRLSIVMLTFFLLEDYRKLEFFLLTALLIESKGYNTKFYNLLKKYVEGGKDATKTKTRKLKVT